MTKKEKKCVYVISETYDYAVYLPTLYNSATLLVK